MTSPLKPSLMDFAPKKCKKQEFMQNQSINRAYIGSSVTTDHIYLTWKNIGMHISAQVKP